MRFYSFTLLFLWFSLLLNFDIQAQSEKDFYKTIKQLSSKKYQGRGPGAKGEALAANFIAKKYKSMQLHALTDNYYQSFEYPVSVIEKTNLKIKGVKLIHGQDYYLHPASKSFKGEVTLLDTNDVKIVFVEKLPPAFIAHKASDITLLFVLENYKSQLSDAIIKLDIEQRYIQSYTSQNVIGLIKGTTYPDSIIVISAHYDHLGAQGKIFFPGANDNASGVSMMMELAHYFSLPENIPTYTLVFIAFGGEEAGLKGSKYFVQSPLFDLSYVSYCLNLDLWGAGSEGLTVVNGKNNKRMMQLFDEANKVQPLKQIKLKDNRANSDHYPFLANGVNAVFIHTNGSAGTYHHIDDTIDKLEKSNFNALFHWLKACIPVNE